MQVQTSEQTLFNILILEKSRVPQKSFITFSTGVVLTEVSAAKRYLVEVEIEFIAGQCDKITRLVA